MPALLNILHVQPGAQRPSCHCLLYQVFCPFKLFNLSGLCGRLVALREGVMGNAAIMLQASPSVVLADPGLLAVTERMLPEAPLTVAFLAAAAV